jgi:hypothetical protein
MRGRFGDAPAFFDVMYMVCAEVPEVTWKLDARDRYWTSFLDGFNVSKLDVLKAESN